MNNKKINKKDLNLLFLLNIVFCFFYAINFIKSYPLSFLLYAVITYIIIIKVYIKIPVIKISYCNPMNFNIKTARYLISISFIYFLVNLNKVKFVDFFLVSYSEKVEQTSIFPMMIPSLLLVISFLLIEISQEKIDKILSSLAIAMLYISSGVTSRGGLLLYLVPIYLIWKDYKITKILMFLLVPLLFILFINIVAFRIGSDNFDISDILFAETQSEVTSILDYDSNGFQPSKLNLIFFFLPSFIKGEWIATNHYISEHMLNLGRDNNAFYVITMSDFGNFFFGYGDFWFLYSIYGLFASLFIIKFLVYYLPTFKYYFLLLFLLIGSRAGTESLLPVFLYGSVLPLLIIGFISNFEIFKKTTFTLQDK